MGTSKVQPNGNGGRYNAQPHDAPLKADHSAKMAAKRTARARRWVKRNPAGAKPPSHIARDLG